MKGDSPAQVRARIDYNTKKLEEINAKIAEAEFAPSGTVDLGKLENSRAYLENVISRDTTNMSQGRKAGVSYKPKGQRGSVNFGFSEFVADQAKKVLDKTPTFDQFVKSIGANKEDQVARDLYEKYYSKEIKQELTPEQKAIQKIPGLRETISPELQPIETMMERWKVEEDLPSRETGVGFIQKILADNFTSGGRVRALRTGNTLIDWYIEDILGETRKTQTRVKEITHDIKGEVNKITGGLFANFRGKGSGKDALVEAVHELQRVEGTNRTPNISPEAKGLYEKLRSNLNDLGRKIQEELALQGVTDFHFRPNYLAGTFFGPYRSANEC